MTITKNIILNAESQEIIVSDDEELLLSEKRMGKPVIFYEGNGKRSYQFAYVVQDMEALEDEDFLREAAFRMLELPRQLFEEGEYTVRELVPADALALLQLYQENKENPSVETFFQTVEEGEAYLREYYKNVYAMDRPGIYGIFREKEFLGLAGYTLHDEGVELSYALLNKYRHQGIMERICKRLLQERIADTVFVRLRKENVPAVRLAEKLSLQMQFM